MKSSTTAMVMEDIICYMGSATDLESDLVSIHGDMGGMDCQATNGCGVHVHAGTDCTDSTDSTTQMGHYYNPDLLAEDPWLIVGYEMTTSTGDADYVGCVTTGETSFLGQAFIIHANDGSRVSCGLLTAPGDEDGETDDTPPDDTAVVAPIQLESDLCRYFLLLPYSNVLQQLFVFLRLKIKPSSI